MKITIDSTNKTIKLHYPTNIQELLDYLKELKIDTKEYSLLGNEIIYQYYPYSPIIPSFNSPIIPSFNSPIYNPSYTTLTTTP